MLVRTWRIGMNIFKAKLNEKRYGKERMEMKLIKN